MSVGTSTTLSYACSSKMCGNVFGKIVVDAKLTCHTLESKQNNFIDKHILLLLLLLFFIWFFFLLFLIHLNFSKSVSFNLLQSFCFHSLHDFVTIYGFWPDSNDCACQHLCSKSNGRFRSENTFGKIVRIADIEITSLSTPKIPHSRRQDQKRNVTSNYRLPNDLFR